MSKNVKIQLNKKGLDNLMKDISENIQENGIDVACPYCGDAVKVYSNIGTCPKCERDFEVKISL